MAGNYQNILNHQDCIPEEKLLNYIEGKLSPQDANSVEQHLLECELCSDALEGLKLLHPEKARAITAELNNKIDKRIESMQNLRSEGQAEKGAKVLPFGSFYRIAAIFVLIALVGGGYWLIKNSKDENAIALNKNPEPAVNKDSVPAQFEAPAGVVSTDEVTASLKKEIVSTTPKFSIEGNKKVENSSAYSSSENIKENEKVGDDPGKTEKDMITSQSDTFFTGNEVALSKIDNSNLNRQQASNAVENYHSSQGAPAAETKSSGVLMKKNADSESSAKTKNASEASGEKSVFERGKTNYDRKNFDAAANDFEKLIKDTASKYYDDSKWYLANCYMRTNRNAKAKKLLQEISNSNSVHNKEAFGLLQEN